MFHARLIGLLSAAIALNACSSDASMTPISTMPKDPDRAEKANVDRFSDAAGHLQRRSDSPNLPAPDTAVDFDQGPFITQGLGPHGETIKYYNFDVQPTAAAPIYVLMKGGQPVTGQLNIVDVIPGDVGYNDFWQIVAVTVDGNYVANTITSADAVKRSGFAMTPSEMLVNCPIVPDGSSANLRADGDSSGMGLVRGWYRDQIVSYFTFGEKSAGLSSANGRVPTSPIYVTFNDDAKGPASGFKLETGSPQSHNVVATLPTDAGYSPLWAVVPYPSAKFSSVSDLATVLTASPGEVAADVNCPIVSIEPKN
jgi:hypothetical protein